MLGGDFALRFALAYLRPGAGAGRQRESDGKRPDAVALVPGVARTEGDVRVLQGDRQLDLCIRGAELEQLAVDVEAIAQRQPAHFGGIDLGDGQIGIEAQINRGGYLLRHAQRKGEFRQPVLRLRSLLIVSQFQLRERQTLRAEFMRGQHARLYPALDQCQHFAARCDLGFERGQRVAIGLQLDETIPNPCPHGPGGSRDIQLGRIGEERAALHARFALSLGRQRDFQFESQGPGSVVFRQFAGVIFGTDPQSGCRRQACRVLLRAREVRPGAGDAHVGMEIKRGQGQLAQAPLPRRPLRIRIAVGQRKALQAVGRAAALRVLGNRGVLVQRTRNIRRRRASGDNDDR